MAGRLLAGVTGDLPLPVRESLERLRAAGFRAIELHAWGPETDPRELGRSGRRDVLRLVRALGMDLVALTAPPISADPQGARAETGLGQAAGVAAMAREMAAGRVAVRLDAPAGPTDPLEQALQELARIAGHYEVVFAVDCPLLRCEEMVARLERLECPWLRALVDVGQVVMRGGDPAEDVGVLADWLGWVRARDARRGRPDRPGEEVALGQGDVDFAAVGSALEAAGYAQPVALRCRLGGDRIAALRTARERLERLWGGG